MILYIICLYVCAENIETYVQKNAQKIRTEVRTENVNNDYYTTSKNNLTIF